MIPPSGRLRPLPVGKGTVPFPTLLPQGGQATQGVRSLAFLLSVAGDNMPKKN